MNVKFAICIGLVGALAVWLLSRDSPHPTSPRLSGVPSTVSASLLQPVAPVNNREAEPSYKQRRPRRRQVSKEEIEFGNALKEQIQRALISVDPYNQDAVGALVTQWVRHDPAGAGRFAKTLPTGTWRQLAMRRVAQAWAGQDPQEAERWAARLRLPDERISALTDICFQVAQTNAQQAMEIAGRNGLEAEPGAVVENLMQQWVAQDFAAAATWISGQPAGAQRDRMVARLAFVQSQTEPARAADLVAEQISVGPIQNEAAISVLHQWAVRDRAAATMWVNQFPAGELRSRAQAELQGMSVYTH